jgi:hypothetical protein
MDNSAAITIVPSGTSTNVPVNTLQHQLEHTRARSTLAPSSPLQPPSDRGERRPPRSSRGYAALRLGISAGDADGAQTEPSIPSYARSLIAGQQ